MAVVAMEAWPSRILYDAGVDPVLDQPRGIAVTKAVWGDPALDACGTGSGGERARQHAVIERRVTEVVGEQPTAIVVGQPQLAQLVENRLRQRHEPLLVALADDAQHLVGPVDGTDFQCGGLADAQTTGIPARPSFVPRIGLASSSMS